MAMRFKHLVAFSATASIVAHQIFADLGTVVTKGGTLVNVFTSLGIVLLDLVAAGACADVTIGVAQRGTVVLAVSARRRVTRAFMAAPLIR
uniref:Putative secreted protein n=1 Tax=Ixodes ricinus TaxID=34613 RepID=A0A6B0U762_IXORI